MDRLLYVIREDELLTGNLKNKVTVSDALIEELASSDLPNSDFLMNKNMHKYGYIIGNRVLVKRGYPRVADCLDKIFEMLMDIPYDGFNAMDKVYELFMSAQRAERIKVLAENMRGAVEISHCSLAPCYGEYMRDERIMKSELCDDRLFAKLKEELTIRRERFLKIKSFTTCDTAFYEGNVKFYNELLAYLEEAENA